MDKYDLIVIGAGPAGYVGAIRGAQLGFRVAIVEKQFLGGTCLNVGCIPSKALLDATHEYMLAKTRFATRGIKISGEVSVDLPALMGFKDKIVRQLTAGVGSLVKKNGITHYVGTARLIGIDSVEVSGETKQVIQGSRILIASGSAPIELPAAPFDGTHIFDSTTALTLPVVPKRLLVIGAGAIGLELGSVWNRLGSEVTMVEFLDRIAPQSDRELAQGLQKAMTKQGVKFSLSTKLKSARREGDTVVAELEREGKVETVTADRMLVSVGRMPATAALNLEGVGVKTTPKGLVEVDENFQTSIPGVYAVGDCIGGAMLAHKASEEAVACVERMAGVAGHVNYSAIPNIIYTAPELASVGMGEEQAKASGREVKVGKYPFAPIGRAKCMDETEGQVKIVADGRTDEVLGIHILHARASDLIAEAAIAMEYRASSEDIARSSHAHPTLAEAIKEAALAVDGRAIHI